jgi:hypothetical protein
VPRRIVRPAGARMSGVSMVVDGGLPVAETCRLGGIPVAAGSDHASPDSHPTSPQPPISRTLAPSASSRRSSSRSSTIPRRTIREES